MFNGLRKRKVCLFIAHPIWLRIILLNVLPYEHHGYLLGKQVQILAADFAPPTFGIFTIRWPSMQYQGDANRSLPHHWDTFQSFWKLATRFGSEIGTSKAIANTNSDRQERIYMKWPVRILMRG
jgi:hypothetical protein